MAFACARQRDQLALGREAEHLVVEQLELGVLEKLLRIGALGEQLDGAAQPGIGAGSRATASRSASRRRPCRARARRCRIRRSRASRGCGSAARRAAGRADHGGVDRAVVVLLRRRDVILEAARHHRPGRMHDAERLVAFGAASSTITRKPKMSDSCSKPTDLRSILRQIE